MMPAYVVTPLMNLQFVWMVLLGAVAFGEMPALTVYIGAAIIMVAGGWLIWDQSLPQRRAAQASAVPAE
jgi:drug/metabolite transporter (DMT)-like permease